MSICVLYLRVYPRSGYGPVDFIDLWFYNPFFCRSNNLINKKNDYCFRLSFSTDQAAGEVTFFFDSGQDSISSSVSKSVKQAVS